MPGCASGVQWRKKVQWHKKRERGRAREREKKEGVQRGSGERWLELCRKTQRQELISKQPTAAHTPGLNCRCSSGFTIRLEATLENDSEWLKKKETNLSQSQHLGQRQKQGGRNKGQSGEKEWPEVEKRSRGPKQVGDREIIVCNDHYIAVVCRSAAGDVSLSLTLIFNEKLNSRIIV